ncbi:hypothetical protein PAAG_08047 [Paracoccidioides lutzii Pb01]|uniref:Uncharacterized protein n=1 Tax=Paracoccidioides lutzii (strain ATCC MYA-826 / Pb01) TaxID=502779 RepID=C1HBA6_PARBA|nr:hypothetical protein PAAG_08047 [Paracoccidioides lutzii Pb01]EEH37629.2 hypothetical protein PAAG_08047 [Paracoccidioides lutzii Pb01]
MRLDMEQRSRQSFVRRIMRSEKKNYRNHSDELQDGPALPFPFPTQRNLEGRSGSGSYREDHSSAYYRRKKPDCPSPANIQSIACPGLAGTRSTQPKGQGNEQRAQGQGSEGPQSIERRPIRINDRPYCSQKCQLGLRDGGYLDPLCPNFHGHKGMNLPIL